MVSTAILNFNHSKPQIINSPIQGANTYNILWQYGNHEPNEMSHVNTVSQFFDLMLLHASPINIKQSFASPIDIKQSFHLSSNSARLSNGKS